MFQNQRKTYDQYQKLQARGLAEVWAIIESVFRAGSTDPLSPEITKEETKRVWGNAPEATYVCEDGNNKIIGTYYLKPNQPALGTHVCNCGYIVDDNARGQGGCISNVQAFSKKSSKARLYSYAIQLGGIHKRKCNKALEAA